LKIYLNRKLSERGWHGSDRPDVDGLTGKLSSLGYVNDEVFAAARAASLQRRGFGERRVRQSLRAAGIEEADTAQLGPSLADGAREAALRFAKRKRIGPFASSEPDREARQKAFAAMLRAGHSMEVVREVLNASPGDFPDLDNI